MMGGSSDKAKGRVKEAVGDLTDNDRMKREGKLDRATGKIKSAIDDTKDKLTRKK
jgi:uncharacterized protein YjbJ (UPF0337 family)